MPLFLELKRRNVIRVSVAYVITAWFVLQVADVVRTASVTSQTGRKLDRAIIVILVVAVAYFALDKYVGNEQVADVSTVLATATATGDRASIAVLPFVNMSSDPEQDYFSDGISEELLKLNQSERSGT